MGVSLYRKYRPRLFSEIVGQEHVRRSLINSIVSGNVSHAYMFCGPRGTGKTTMAKLLARAINCANRPEGEAEPCNECPSCKAALANMSMDVVEIDAASNRGIDDIRDLREKVGFAPSMGKYKVFIIDEAHMLTSAAANAFLKTLEEPPPHVVFVLATTEPHNIIPTIASRCQRYDFKLVPVQACFERLKEIVEAESSTRYFRISDEALAFVARRGGGSLRDALSLLDQVLAFCGTEIELDDVMATLGMMPFERVFEMVECLHRADFGGLVEKLHFAALDGWEPAVMAGQLTAHLHSLLRLKAGAVEPVRHEVGEGLLPRMEQQASFFGEMQLLWLLEGVERAMELMRDGQEGLLALEVSLLGALHSSSFVERGKMVERISRLERIVHRLSLRRGTLPCADAPPSDAASVPATESVPPAAARAQATAQIQSSARSDAARPGRAGKEEEPAVPSTPDSDERRIAESYGTMLKLLQKEQPLTYALLQEGRFAGVSGNTVIVRFPPRCSFHRERLQEKRHASLVARYVREVLGRDWKIRLEEAPGKQEEGEGRPSPAGPPPAAGSAAVSGGGFDSGERPLRSVSSAGGDAGGEDAVRSDKRVREILETFDGHIFSIE